MAEEAGGQLRVEQPGRHGATGPAQHLEVLLGGVEDGQPRTVEQGGEGADVDRQGVDQGRLATPRQLQQGQLGVVGPLPVELGVEGIGRLGGGSGKDLGEAGVVGDPEGAGRHEGLSPSTTSRPLSIQASVPPATLTARTPLATRNSLAT